LFARVINVKLKIIYSLVCQGDGRLYFCQTGMLALKILRAAWLLGRCVTDFASLFSL